MILSTNQKQIRDTDSRLGEGSGEGLGWTGRLGLVDANYIIWCRWAIGAYCTVQGTVCDCVTLLYNRNCRNIVNQLNFNLKKKENYSALMENSMLVWRACEVSL